MANYLGTVLDNRYEMLEIIGTGGMAVVYKARDVKLNRFVAVKILKDEILQDEELRKRFHNEAEAVAALSHPNIVSIFDVSLTRRMEYFVMELIDGITLKQYMQQRGVLSEAELEHFIIQILKALEHAHSRGIIHRDIKPQNVMILRDGTVKVTDFGIARMANHQQTVTQNAFGSVHYIAPEQAKGGVTDGRADLYSVGIIMYEMLTGELPFTGDTPVAVAIQHLSANPPSPSTKNPNVTPGMESIVLKAMATDPDDRYATASAMLSDLESYKANPLIPVGYYSEQKSEEKEGEEGTLPTKIVGEIRTDANGDYVAPPPRVRRQKARFKYNEKLPIIAGILSALVFMIVAVVVFVSLLKGCEGEGVVTIEVPKLVGENYEEVLKMMASSEEYQFLRIKIGTEEYTDTAEEGTIVAQNPIAGSKIKSNATITVDVSLGIREINMIDVVGLDSSEGANRLSTLFTQNKISNVMIRVQTELSETVEANRIIRTEPAVGTPIHAGDTVTLIVSLGATEQTVVMPNLIGDSLTKAIKTLSDMKINLGQVVEKYDDADPGTVIGQSIARDTVIKEGDSVDLIVSKGPETVETQPETSSETETETSSESETGSETETSTETETSSETETTPVETGEATWTFQPKVLSDRFTDSDVFTVKITANGVTIKFASNVTINSSDITVTHKGNKGEDCKFEVFINDAIFTSYVAEFK